MPGKCPKCDHPVRRLQGDGVEITVVAGATLRGLTYSCPSCSAVLGCQVDPIAIRTDIINGLLSELRG